jgi:transcriptional regulator with XRE-family HTH domain
MPLGDNLAALRKRRNLTLDALEELSGVDRAVIHAIESRHSRASKHAAALARALGVSLDALLGEGVPVDGPAAKPAPPLPPRDFSDRHEVSDTDWGLLQDVHLVMTDEELSALRTRAERLRRIAQEQLETVAASAPPPRPNFGASPDWKQIPSPLRQRRDGDQEKQG